MNKMRHIFFALFFFCFGCATVSSSDIPSLPKRKEISIPKKDRKDMTFSVLFLQEVRPSGEEIITNKQDIIDEVKEEFKESKLFNKVHYAEMEEASNYHFHFNVIMTGTHPQTQLNVGLAGAYLLYAFPLWFNYNIDITMHLFIDGKEVYSVTAPQKVKDIFWTPFIIAWPVFNRGIIGNNVENNAMDYFISEIIENKLYDYQS